jgi:hypothetical protein
MTDHLFLIVERLPDGSWSITVPGARKREESWERAWFLVREILKEWKMRGENGEA